MLDQLINQINENIEQASSYEAELRRELHQLETQGVYAQVPNEQWQRRPGNDNEYLYHIFRKTDNGGFGGPDGREKLYIGCKKSRILAARIKASRTENALEIAQCARGVRAFIRNRDYEVRELQERAERILARSTEWSDIQPKRLVWDDEFSGIPDGDASSQGGGRNGHTRLAQPAHQSP